MIISWDMGTSATVPFIRMESSPCRVCNGDGKDQWGVPFRCLGCSGQGVIWTAKR